MPPTTTEASSDDGDFFDDDNNKAMYLVLPAMILIYGSCCLVYCVHKARRYCVKKSRKKKRMEKRTLIKKQGKAFDNPGVTLSDEQLYSHPGPSGNPPPVILTLENMESDQPPQQALVNRRTSRETDVDSLVDVLQSESVSAVTPGYGAASLRQEMQHLDNQLKAAFRLTSQEGVKTTKGEVTQEPVRPLQKHQNGGQPQHSKRNDVIQAYKDWKALQKTQPPKLELKYTPSGDTIVVRIPKEKRLQMIQEQQKESQAMLKQEADVSAMVAVRQKINKPGIPKSMPDILKNPEENVSTLKKQSSDTKRRIYLSSQ